MGEGPGHPTDLFREISVSQGCPLVGKYFCLAEKGTVVFRRLEKDTLGGLFG